MDKHNLYSYTDNNLLESKNTYFYTQYIGAEFISAWYQNRASVCSNSVDEVTVPDSKYGLELNSNLGKDILEYLYACVDADKDTDGLLALLAQRFEVSKRIYSQYTPELRATESANDQELSLYIRFGEVLDLAYEKSASLSQLNALIKLVDILVSVADQISAEMTPRFNRLRNAEKKHIESLIHKLQISI